MMQVGALPPPNDAPLRGGFMPNSRHENARLALQNARKGREKDGIQRRQAVERELRRLELAEVEAGRTSTDHVQV